MLGKLFKPKEKNLNREPTELDGLNTDTKLDRQSVETTPNWFDQFLKRQGNYSRKTHLAQYQPRSSFVDKLPWVEFLDAEKAMLLEDGRSVGAVFELGVIGTEGRSIDYLENVRTLVCNAIQDSFPELDNHPWVVQFFCQDDEISMSYEHVLRDYVRQIGKQTRRDIENTAFTQQWLKIMENTFKMCLNLAVCLKIKP